MFIAPVGTFLSIVRLKCQLRVDYETNIQTIANPRHHLVDDSWSTHIFSIELLPLLMLLFFAGHYSPL